MKSRLVLSGIVAVAVAVVMVIVAVAANLLTALVPSSWTWVKDWRILIPVIVGISIVFGLLTWLYTILTAGKSRQPGAHLEVISETRETGMTVRYLTTSDLSRQIWSQRLLDRERPGVGRLEAGRKIASFDRSVGPDLDAERMMLPEGRPADYSRPFRVGIDHATVPLNVRVRNRGTESAGISFRAPRGGEAELTPRPPALAALGSWVTYAVTVDNPGPIKVAPDDPGAVPVTLKLQAHLDESRQDDPIAVARASRAFATFLTGPIGPVPITGILDSGKEIEARLTLKLADPDDQLLLNDLDIDELERHFRPIDKVVKDQYWPARGRDGALSYERTRALHEAEAFLEQAEAQGALELTTAEIRDELVEIADRLEEYVEDSSIDNVRPKDPDAAVASCRALRELARADPAQHPQLSAQMIRDLIAQFKDT